MRRRRMLYVLGIGLSVGGAGCTASDSETPTPPVTEGARASPTPSPGSPDEAESPSPRSPLPEEFSQCEKLVVRIQNLPPPAREEAEVALTEGWYETDQDLYLSHVMPVSESYLADAGGETERHYRALVVENGRTTRLELEPAIPSHGREPLGVTNDTADHATVEIRVERHRGSETVTDATLSISSDATARTVPFDRRFGTYRVDVDTGRVSGYIEWEEREYQFPMEEVVITPEGLAHEPRPVLEPLDCQELWDRAYDG